MTRWGWGASKRLRQEGDGGTAIRHNTDKKGLSTGSEHCPHTAGVAPPPEPRSRPQPGPSAPRHHTVTPSVPALETEISEVPGGRTPTWPSPTEDWAHQAKQQQPLEAEDPKGRARARSHRGRFRRFHSTLGRFCLSLLHHFPTQTGPQSWPRCARLGRARARD